MRSKQQIDIVLASFAFFIAVCVATICYAQVRMLEAPKGMPLTFLHQGSTFFKILQADDCIGSLNLKLDKTKGYALDGSGEMRASYAGVFFVVKISLASVFNPLGQLNNLLIDVVTKQAQAHLRATEVNPIKLAFALDAPNTNYRKEIQLPGPLEIRQRPSVGLNTAEYEISHPLSNMAALGGVQKLAPLFSESLGLSIVPAQQSDLVSCANMNALELSRLVSSLSKLSGTLDQRALGLLGVQQP